MYIVCTVHTVVSSMVVVVVVVAAVAAASVLCVRVAAVCVAVWAIVRTACIACTHAYIYMYWYVCILHTGVCHRLNNTCNPPST